MIAYGQLLMNGTTVEWPPRDMNGQAIEIGVRVYGAHDTCNLQHERAYVVGALRLQIQRGQLAWVACAYDDDDGYMECFAEDCAVLRR